MIVKDSRLEPPHGNTIIWRYMGLDKFIDLIISKNIFFTNAARMTDKYEGIVPKRNREQLKRELKGDGLSSYEAKSESSTKYWMVDSLRSLTLLNCWTMNQNESYDFWKIYLDGSKAGVAIRTTVGKLGRAIKKGADPYDEDIFISKVNYSDYLKQPDSRFEVTSTKKRFYEYEKELRLFIFHYPLSEGGVEPPYDLSIGRKVKVDTLELIDEIYLSPFAGSWFNESFRKNIKQVAPELLNRIKNSEIMDE